MKKYNITSILLCILFLIPIHFWYYFDMQFHNCYANNRFEHTNNECSIYRTLSDYCFWGWTLSLIALIIFTIFKIIEYKIIAIVTPLITIATIVALYFIGLLIFILIKSNCKVQPENPKPFLNNIEIAITPGHYQLINASGDSLIRELIGNEVIISGDTLKGVTRIKTIIYQIKKAEKYYIETNDSKSALNVYIENYNDSALGISINSNYFTYKGIK